MSGICDKKHEWEAIVRDRSHGNGCPCCPSRVYKNNYLEKVNPILVREWNPTKNGSLTSGDVTTALKERYGGFAKTVMNGKPGSSEEIEEVAARIVQAE